MRLALDGSFMNEFTRQITSTSTPVEMSDTFANPLQQRLRGQISFSKGSWVSNGFVHYRNSYLDNRFPPFVGIDSYTTVDANVGYHFDEGLLSNTTLSLSAINLLDEDPPPTRVRPTTGVFDLGFDPANASPMGRMVSLELTTLW
jgi:outer membrane receptor protein involved in Fe transport